MCTWVSFRLTACLHLFPSSQPNRLKKMNTGGSDGGGMKVEDDGREKRRGGKQLSFIPLSEWAFTNIKLIPSFCIISSVYYLCMLMCACVCVYFSLIKNRHVFTSSPFLFQFYKNIFMCLLTCTYYDCILCMGFSSFE